ncbi:hypothetical protein [uncultured Tateyamaria sp.]|uniref:hypothetical protein n=1 Tax=uncultured Tateyamaria sp. TaxID=455651 RepID=UPI002620B5F1|nr:hypothetical protein [uncultured Tateyamaria sp.]
MSFLPHAASKGLTWYGSLTASALTHAGVVGFFMFSGAVAFLPEPEINEPDAPEFAVSLEILDADIVDEAEVIDESAVIPPDAVALDPDDLATLAPDDNVLAPLDEDTLGPLQDEALAPSDDLALPDDVAVTEPELAEPDLPEPEVIAPEVLEPDVTEPEAVDAEVTEPEVVEPEPTEPEIVEPEIADLQPEETGIEVPDDTPATPEPEPAPAPEPLVVAPEDPSPLAIDGLSPIDDTVLNPLAEGGAGPLPDVGPEEGDALVLAPEPTPAPDELALLAPEPTPEPAPTVVTPDADAPAPVALPDPVEPEVAKPEEAAPDEGETADTEPEITEPDGEGAGDGTADAPVVPSAPATRPLPNPTASDIAIGQLLRRIRATPQPQCTLALPRRAGGDPGAGVSFIGADLDVLDELAGRVLDGLDFEPIQTREEIDLRQCATLDVLRQSDSYPASRIGLALDSSSLVSGDSLSGRVIGAEGLFVTLLLVDDNGVVQDMTPFVRLEGNTPVFEAPVARSGPNRATRQILLALGTQGAPLAVTERIGNVAQDVFAPIPGEVLRAMVFGIATFDVR